MEIRDYFTILRRRWATIGVVFICLLGIFTVYLVAKERTVFSATSKLGVLTERRFFYESDPVTRSSNQTGYSYYTKEALLGSKHVRDTAAVVYRAVQGEKLGNEVEERAFWKETDQEKRLAAMIREKGLGDVETDKHGRIVALNPNRKEISDVSPRFAGVNVSKPDDRVQLISLTVQSATPEEAKLIVNSLAKGSVIYSRLEALKGINNMKEELEGLRDKVEKEKIVKEVGNTNLSSEQEGLKTLQADLSRLEQQINSLRSRKEQLELRINSLWVHAHVDSTLYSSVPEDEGLTSAILEELRGDIISLNVSTATKKFVWQERNPQLLRMNEQLSQLKSQYAMELNRVRKAELGKLSLEDADLDRKETILDSLQESKLKALKVLKKRVAELDKLDGKLNRYEEIQSSLRMAGPRQRGFYAFEDVADSAGSAPHQWPRSIGLFALVSFILAVAGAFLVEYADTNLRTDYDIRRYINIPCISLFEEVKSGSPFILRGSPKDPASENFNMAASIVRTYLTERNFKTLAVCSAIPKEGKTTIACNVAVAMARKGLRIVVVDADLRIPQIHEIFSISNGRGLSSLLKGEIPIDQLDDALIKTDLETLTVLPSGPVPESPNTLLESQKMVDLVNALRARFDVVLFDTPPITSVGDTLTLARLVDTNLLVVAAGLSDRRSVIWAKQMLTSVRGEICGGVLNFVKRRQVSAYYYYYSYYHSSSGSKKSKSLRGKD